MKRFLTRQAAWAIVAFLALVCSTIPTHAVGPTGKIVGTVTDPSGSVVASATVTAANTLTGVKTTSTTTKTGHYVIPMLKPGPPWADARASCTPNQTSMMVASAITM